MHHFERKSRPSGTKRMDIINPNSTINNMNGVLFIVKGAKILKKIRIYRVNCIKKKIKIASEGVNYAVSTIRHPS